MYTPQKPWWMYNNVYIGDHRVGYDGTVLQFYFSFLVSCSEIFGVRGNMRKQLPWDSGPATSYCSGAGLLEWRWQHPLPPWRRWRRPRISASCGKKDIDQFQWASNENDNNMIRNQILPYNSTILFNILIMFHRTWGPLNPFKGMPTRILPGLPGTVWAGKSNTNVNYLLEECLQLQMISVGRSWISKVGFHDSLWFFMIHVFIFCCVLIFCFAKENHLHAAIVTWIDFVRFWNFDHIFGLGWNMLKSPTSSCAAFKVWYQHQQRCSGTEPET